MAAGGACDAGALAGRGGSSSSARRGAGGSKGGAASTPPVQLPDRGGDMLPLMLQVSADLEAEPAAEEGPSSTYSGRDTAGGAPASPATSEAAAAAGTAAGASSSSHSRGRAHRVGTPTRSSGSKQQLAAAQHKLPPDQEQHHPRQQGLYAAEMEDDTLQAPGQEDKYESEEGHLYNSDGMSELHSDGRCVFVACSPEAQLMPFTMPSWAAGLHFSN